MRWRPLTLAAVIAMLLAGCPDRWHLARVEGERPTVHPKLWDEVHATATEIESEVELDGTCRDARRPLVHCANLQHRGLCKSSHDASPPSPSTLRPLWSFVHMSDVQLKEHRVTMEGAISTEAYDGLTNGALRHPQLERHDDAVLLATVLSINALADTQWLEGTFAPYPTPRRPRFVLHTGDAVDVGLFSELTQFLVTMGELKLPFYNAVGNHDGLFFGTFPFERIKGANVLLPYVPIYDSDRFMRFHSPEGAAADLSVPEMKQASGNEHPPTRFGVAFAKDQLTAALQKGRDGPQSDFHGFDLACHRGRKSGKADGGLCQEARGYYSFDVALPDLEDERRRLRFVVLNTSEILPETISEGFSRLSKGHLQPEQLRWLEHEVTRGSEDGATVYSIVAGHHTLDSMLKDQQRERLLEIFTHRPRVLAYLSGHTHRDDAVRHLYDGKAVWELTAGSTLVYPQLSRLVELFEDTSEGRLWLRVATFRQQLSDHVNQLPAASRCAQLARRTRLGRGGAERDTDHARTDEAVAIQKANGLFLVDP